MTTRPRVFPARIAVARDGTSSSLARDGMLLSLPLLQRSSVSLTMRAPLTLEERTDELETAIYSGTLEGIQKYAERILRQRESAPYRKLAQRTYNVAAWSLAFSVGTFIVALVIFWLIATGYRLP